MTQDLHLVSKEALQIIIYKAGSFNSDSYLAPSCSLGELSNVSYQSIKLTTKWALELVGCGWVDNIGQTQQLVECKWWDIYIRQTQNKGRVQHGLISIFRLVCCKSFAQIIIVCMRIVFQWILKTKRPTRYFVGFQFFFIELITFLFILPFCKLKYLPFPQSTTQHPTFCLLSFFSSI